MFAYAMQGGHDKHMEHEKVMQMQTLKELVLPQH